MMPVLKLIWLVWTFLLSGACANALAAPCSNAATVSLPFAFCGMVQGSFAYDAPTQGGIAYDHRSKCNLAYDAASVLAPGERKNGTIVVRVLFAYFARFVAAERALKLPATDASLIGTTKLGYTTPQGNVFLRPGLTRAEQAYVLRHEGVHVFFTPKGSGPLATFRQNLGQFGYDNFQLLRFTEEAIAETHASGSLLQGLRHPLVNPYGITPGGLLMEGGVVGGGLFGAGYLGYQSGGGN
jgi:hypothetical protein